MCIDDSAARFQAFRNLHGIVVPADTYKRNGQRVLRYQPQTIDMSTTDNGSDAGVLRVLSAGLNAIERRTWWRILDGWSLPAIAEADHVSRAAIYCRIRGTNGHGGMVRKNRWVALWWEARALHESL